MGRPGCGYRRVDPGSNHGRRPIQPLLAGRVYCALDPAPVIVRNAYGGAALQIPLGFGADRRGGADRLPLPGALYHWRLAAHAPCLAVRGIGSQARFILEEDVCILPPGLRGNGRILLTLPFLDGFRVTLVGTLQRLLRRQPQFRQQPAYCVSPSLMSNFCSINWATMDRGPLTHLNTGCSCSPACA